jgi:hypothetical protein
VDVTTETECLPACGLSFCFAAAADAAATHSAETDAAMTAVCGSFSCSSAAADSAAMDADADLTVYYDRTGRASAHTPFILLLIAAVFRLRRILTLFPVVFVLINTPLQHTLFVNFIYGISVNN